MNSKGSIFWELKCPVCGDIIHYRFNIDEAGKMWETKCLNCRTQIRRRIPKKSNDYPEQLG